MDSNEYRIRGKEMVDYIADYLENIRDRKVFPAGRKPGFLREQIPDSAPYQGEEWSKIFGDIEKLIMPGVTHWQSPHMHAYFPALTSYPSMLGEMLANAINCVGFTWASSPACTELEIAVMDWLAKMIGLPEEFLHRKGKTGGGVIQTTASEATLVSLLASRWKSICKFKKLNPGSSNSDINKKLVAYASDQAHSSVLKAALIGLVDIRFIACDDDLSMRGPALLEAVKKDQEMGRIPFWVCATLGTTGACAFDNLQEIGQVCNEQELWLHVDAAYAGSAFVCPEYRGWLKGIEHVDTIAFNPSKWLLVHFDCTAMWVKDSCPLYNAFNVNPLYLVHEFSGVAIDFTDWQIPLSRRFRALKLWFVIRNYGVKGLQDHIRKGVALAHKFETLVTADDRFEIVAKRNLGMVVFRLAGDGDSYKEGITERLLQALNHRGKIHCIPSKVKSKFVIRFTVTSPRTTEEDIVGDWQEIQTVATEVLESMDNVGVAVKKAKVYLGETKKHDFFGTSLLLSNTPMSPKIVNGSFAAVFKNDLISEFSKTIRLREDAQNSPAMRRRIKGILMSGKQFSLDSRLDLFHGIEPRSDQPNLSPLEDETEDNDSSFSVDSNFLSMENLSLDGGTHRICKSQSDHQVPGMVVDDYDQYEKNMLCKKCGHPIPEEGC